MAIRVNLKACEYYVSDLYKSLKLNVSILLYCICSTLWIIYAVELTKIGPTSSVDTKI